ncbi:hypothetical protein LZ30DRAFT_717814 [Colletotrichum cereale]|nr:hypothetical protein LZ30DRAFT_717814 [Colletotrichum cereale]
MKIKNLLFTLAFAIKCTTAVDLEAEEEQWECYCYTTFNLPIVDNFSQQVTQQINGETLKCCDQDDVKPAEWLYSFSSMKAVCRPYTKAGTEVFEQRCKNRGLLGECYRTTYKRNPGRLLPKLEE